MFTRQLATMIDAGLPLVQALTALTEQTAHKNFKPILVQITTTIESGEPLSSTLAKHGQVFDRLYVNMVKAGESGGVLAENGPWAMFRLFGKGTLSPAGSPERYTLSFGLGNRQATFELRAASVLNPFAPGVLRDFRCPSVRD